MIVNGGKNQQQNTTHRMIYSYYISIYDTYLGMENKLER